MQFTNFWCNVSKITMGPNVQNETVKAIAEAVIKYCDTKQPGNATIAQ